MQDFFFAALKLVTGPSSDTASNVGTEMVRAFSLEMLCSAWNFHVENPHAQPNICYFRQIH